MSDTIAWNHFILTDPPPSPVQTMLPLKQSALTKVESAFKVNRTRLCQATTEVFKMSGIYCHPLWGRLVCNENGVPGVDG